jgi:hypothetical protein
VKNVGVEITAYLVEKQVLNEDNSPQHEPAGGDPEAAPQKPSQPPL